MCSPASVSKIHYIRFFAFALVISTDERTTISAPVVTFLGRLGSPSSSSKSYRTFNILR